MVDPLCYVSVIASAGVTKTLVCAIPCCLLKRVAHVVAAAGFLSRYLNGPVPYVRSHITVNKMY